jgi:hypothetical protein
MPDIYTESAFEGVVAAQLVAHGYREGAPSLSIKAALSLYDVKSGKAGITRICCNRF